MSGAVSAVPGLVLEVWVEDDRPGCAGKDLAVASYYGRAGTTKLYEWRNEMHPILSLRFQRNRARNNLLLMSFVEASPEKNPNNACGQEAASVVSQHAVNNEVIATRRQVIPASHGQGHAILSLQSLIKGRNIPSRINADLLTSSELSTRVTTGGCCGDGMLVGIQF